jgi:hypothetical protein
MRSYVLGTLITPWMLLVSSDIALADGTPPNPANCLANIQGLDIVSKSQLQLSCFQVAIDFCEQREDCISQIAENIEARYSDIRAALPETIDAEGFSASSYHRGLKEISSLDIMAECSDLDGDEIAVCHYMHQALRLIESYRLANLADAL